METYANTALLRQAQIVSTIYGLILGNRAYIGNHPAFDVGYMGDVSGQSAEKSKPLVDLGVGVAPAVADTVAATTVDLNFDELDVTVERRSTGREKSSMAAIFDPTGAITDPGAMAFDAVSIRQNTLTSMLITAGVAGLTTNTPIAVGGAMEFDALHDGEAVLNGQDVEFGPGDLAFICHPVAWSQMKKEMGATGKSDAFSHAPEGYNMLLARKNGYQGRYFGYDVFTNNRIPKGGGDTYYENLLLAPYALIHGKASIPPQQGASEVILGGGDVHVEFERAAANFTGKAFYNMMLGAAVGDAKRGVIIRSNV